MKNNIILFVLLCALVYCTATRLPLLCILLMGVILFTVLVFTTKERK